MDVLEHSHAANLAQIREGVHASQHLSASKYHIDILTDKPLEQ